jgi:hypothetical protein
MKGADEGEVCDGGCIVIILHFKGRCCALQLSEVCGERTTWWEACDHRFSCLDLILDMYFELLIQLLEGGDGQVVTIILWSDAVTWSGAEMGSGRCC